MLDVLKTVYQYYTGRPRLRWTLCALAVFIPAFGYCYYGLDPDFGWHLQAGNYIREHGVPAYDVFSYTAGSFRWIDHEWGSDVLLSVAYGIGGYGFVSLLAALMWTAALLLAAGKRANPVILLLAVAALHSYIAVRPTAITVLLFAIVWRVLKHERLKYYWWLPLLFVVWANLHAGFIAGLALVGYFMVLRRSKRLALILALCLAATLCNVYGFRIYEEVVRTIFDGRLHERIGEWHSFSIGLIPLIYVGIWMLGYWRYEHPFWGRWLRLSPLLLLASFSATRNVPLFVLASLQEITQYWSHYIRSIIADLPRTADLPRKIVGGLVACVLLIVVSFIGTNANPFRYTNPEARYPAAAVRYLQQHPCEGHIYNNYNYGGYLIWKLPKSQVYIDGRMPTWEPYMTDYLELKRHPADRYRSEFTKYDIRCALLSKQGDKETVKVLKGAGWRITVQDKRSVLLLAPNGAR